MVEGTGTRRGSSTAIDFIAAASNISTAEIAVRHVRYVTETDGSTSTAQDNGVSLQQCRFERRKERKRSGILAVRRRHLMTPSASIVAAATATETVIDGDGRDSFAG
jgi:hypothetical protein